MPEVSDFEGLMESMTRNPAGPLVRKLPRQTGQKEARWTQLLTGEPVLQTEFEVPFKPVAEVSNADLERRVTELEALVQLLISEVETLRTTGRSSEDFKS